MPKIWEFDEIDLGIGPEHPGYLPMAIDGEPYCGAFDGGWFCTRKHGHGGEHAAHDLEGRQLFRWKAPEAISIPEGE